MKNFPSRIEIIVEPELFAGQDDLNIIRMRMKVVVNGREISDIYIKPFDFFMSHFDIAVQSMVREIKTILNEKKP